MFKQERPCVEKSSEGSKLRKKKLNIEKRQGSQKESHRTQIRGLPNKGEHLLHLRLRTNKDCRKSRPGEPMCLTHAPQPGSRAPDTQFSAFYNIVFLSCPN